MRVRLAVVILAATVCATAAAAPSFSSVEIRSAPVVRFFPTKLSIHSHTDDMTLQFVFTGRVRSGKAGCVHDRVVKLRNTTQPGSLSSASADEDGHYEIRIDDEAIPGKFFTRARRVERPGYVCGSAESERIPPG